MHTILIISALLALAAASLNPEDFYLNAIEGAGAPTFTYKGKRGVNDGDCAPQPSSSAPYPDEDTVPAFYAYPVYSSSAQSAPTPGGYSRNFVNLQASSNAETFLGLYTLGTYDTHGCSERCNAVDICTAFNIYYERDPIVKPAAECPNPPSLTNIKCNLWAANVTTETAKNSGQYRRDFHVVIAGSNAYLGTQFFNGPYDAILCASACNLTTEYDRRHAVAGSYTPCNFFNAYVLSRNGSAGEGTTCSFYSQAWNNTYATNCGQSRGNENYTVNTSYGFTHSPLDTGRVASTITTTT